MTNSLTKVVEQYKPILPSELYTKLLQAASEVSEDMVPVMEPAFRIELHRACEEYFAALKKIGKEMQDDKKTFLKEAERVDKQQEMSELTMSI